MPRVWTHDLCRWHQKVHCWANVFSSTASFVTFISRKREIGEKSRGVIALILLSSTWWKDYKKINYIQRVILMIYNNSQCWSTQANVNFSALFLEKGNLSRVFFMFFRLIYMYILLVINHPPTKFQGLKVSGKISLQIILETYSTSNSNIPSIMWSVPTLNKICNNLYKNSPWVGFSTYTNRMIKNLYIVTSLVISSATVLILLSSTSQNQPSPRSLFSALVSHQPPWCFPWLFWHHRAFSTTQRVVFWFTEPNTLVFLYSSTTAYRTYG